MLLNKKTKNIATAAVMSALCFVMLLLGSIITVMDLSTAALASLVVIFCVIELGSGYSLMVWAVVSVLAILMLPDKFGPLVFLAFSGYYPVLKRIIENRFPVVIQWILKILLFNVALTVIIAVSRFIIGISADEIAFSVAVYLLCNFVFVIFDIALTRMILFYFIRLRKKLKIFK